MRIRETWAALLSARDRQASVNLMSFERTNTANARMVLAACLFARVNAAVLGGEGSLNF
jgi:hypothetical protein